MKLGELPDRVILARFEEVIERGARDDRTALDAVGRLHEKVVLREELLRRLEGRSQQSPTVVAAQWPRRLEERVAPIMRAYQQASTLEGARELLGVKQRTFYDALAAIERRLGIHMWQRTGRPAPNVVLDESVPLGFRRLDQAGS